MATALSPRRVHTSLLASRLPTLDTTGLSGQVYFKPASIPGSPVGSPRAQQVLTHDAAYFKFDDGVTPDLLLLAVETSHVDDAIPRNIVFTITRDSSNSVLWKQFRHLVTPLLQQVIESMPDSAILNDENNILQSKGKDSPFLFYSLLTNSELPANTYMRIDRSKPRLATPTAPTMSVTALRANETQQRRESANTQRRSEKVIVIAAAREDKLQGSGIGEFLKARAKDPGLTYEVYLRRVEKERRKHE